MENLIIFFTNRIGLEISPERNISVGLENLLTYNKMKNCLIDLTHASSKNTQNANICIQTLFDSRVNSQCQLLYAPIQFFNEVQQ